MENAFFESSRLWASVAPLLASPAALLLVRRQHQITDSPSISRVVTALLWHFLIATIGVLIVVIAGDWYAEVALHPGRVGSLGVSAGAAFGVWIFCAALLGLWVARWNSSPDPVGGRRLGGWGGVRVPAVLCVGAIGAFVSLPPVLSRATLFSVDEFGVSSGVFVVENVPTARQFILTSDVLGTEIRRVAAGRPPHRDWVIVVGADMGSRSDLSAGEWAFELREIAVSDGMNCTGRVARRLDSAELTDLKCQLGTPL